MTPLANARCAVHHEAPAVVVCTRCGAFACEACAVLTRAPLVCRACEPFLDARPSPWATWSVWLTAFGVAGLFCGPFVPLLNLLVVPAAVLSGPVGLVLAVIERRAINRREAPAAGNGRVGLAIAMGVFHLCVLALGLGVAVWLKYFMGPVVESLSVTASPRPSSVQCR